MKMIEEESSGQALECKAPLCWYTYSLRTAAVFDQLDDGYSKLEILLMSWP